MERLQGPINPPCFFGEHLDVECLELGYGPLLSTESQRSGVEGEAVFSGPGLADKMPFLQMLQSVESPPFSPFTEPNFQALLRLQHQKKPWGMTTTAMTRLTEVDSRVQALELESCITHDVLEMHSPSPVKSDAKEPLHHPHSSSECNQDHPNSAENGCLETNSGSSPAWFLPQNRQKQTHVSRSPPTTSRERRKRKRTRPTKNKEEVESQRMTHIAVERNRRRQMNDHLNALRSLMPTSYIQRGDQASIIGGAIDFVKELEQLLESLQAQKRMRKIEKGGDAATNSSSSPNTVSKELCTQHKAAPDDGNSAEGGRSEDPTFTAENKSPATDMVVTVIQTHVNLKIQCRRRPGQLLKAIVAVEDLGLTVLHLNITSLQSSILYSFNLKIEDNCKLSSADEVEAAVRQVFNIINGSSI